MKNRADGFLTDEKKKNARRAWARMGMLAVLLLTAGLLLRDAAPPRDDPAAGQTASPMGKPALTPAPTYGRTAREAAYDKDMAALRAIVAQKDAEETVRNQAAEQLARMISGHQIEIGIEEALHNAGFASGMALMQNDALTVTVSAEELTPEAGTTILSICVAHSDVAVENIRIMSDASS